MMFLCSVAKDQVIFEQGSIGNFFYIIVKGEVDVKVNGNYVKTMTQGDSFGELALLHGAPRSATIIAKEETLFWCLGRVSFKKVITQISNLTFEENKKFIDSLPMLSALETKDKTILCSNLMKETYEAGSYIIKIDQPADCLYILKDGYVDCITSEQKLVRVIEKGDHFGEKSLLMQSNRTMNIVAKTKCECYSVSIPSLKMIIGNSYKEAIVLNIIKNAFAISNTMNKVSPNMIENSFIDFEIKNYNLNEKVLEMGSVIQSKLIIILEGNIVQVCI